MEKRIARIARWLNRCAEACSARSWQSALMDMECAKAELEEARRDLWARAEGRQQPFNAAWRAARAVGASVLGLFLVMASAMPLAAPAPGHRERASALMESSSSLEWVSTDEKALLTALRSSLSDANLARLSALAGDAPVKAAIPAEEGTRAGFRQKPVPAAEEAVKHQTSSHGGREFDTIINLVQIGQRSLREREPAVRFDAP